MRAISLFAGLAVMLAATSASADTTLAPATNVTPVQPLTQPPPQAVKLAPLAVYDQESKNRFGALVLEYFLPGAGCIYAGNSAAAFKTWVMTLGGAAVYLYGLKLDRDGLTGQGPEGMMIGGLISVLVGRVLGLYDAWSSASEHNEGLRTGLGLGDD
jgi:hypothetical protein